MIGTSVRILALSALAILAAWPAAAQLEFIDESFEPSAEWSWGLPTTTVSEGGAPGAYLSSAVLESALPKLATGIGVESKFVGDFRASQVQGVGVMLQIGSVGTPQGRGLSLLLTHDGGTPHDVDDDCAAYFVGRNIPLPGDGWKKFVFHVPSETTTLPAGWNLLSAAGNLCPGMTDDEAWNHVITNVSRLEFSYGDPSLFYIFQTWVGLAMDSPTIARRR